MTSTDTPRDPLYFLPAGSKAAAEIRAFDWTANPLGPPQDWSPSLKTAVGMMLSSDFPKAIVWGPSLITLHNDAFRPILGEKPSAIGRPFSDVWAEAWAGISEIAARAFAGQSTYIEDFPLVIDRHGYPEEAFFTFCYSPIHDIDGTVAGFMDTVIETTATVETRNRLETINGELLHRMRNMVTMASALADQSLRGATSIEAAREAMRRRFMAIAQAQTVLTSADKAAIGLRHLVEQVLAPHGFATHRLTIDGPALELGSRQVLALSLALNELLTNAVKYGALSTEAGRVDIRWAIGQGENGDEFRFDWRESAGPVVSLPARTGFGTKLIERFVAADFGGQARLSFDPDGVGYSIRTSMRAITPET